MNSIRATVVMMLALTSAVNAEAPVGQPAPVVNMPREPRALLDGSGFAYRYLPAYSPDLNPIEPIWAKVKAELRRVAARTAEALHQALGPALNSVTPQNAPGCFRHCGYVRPN